MISNLKFVFFALFHIMHTAALQSPVGPPGRSIHILQMKPDDETTKNSQKALWESRKVSEPRSKQEHSTHPLQKTKQQTWISAQSESFFQMEMENNHIEEAEFNIADVLGLGGKRLATFVGLDRSQGSSVVNVLLALSVTLALFMALSVVVRGFARIQLFAQRRSSRKLAEMALPESVPDLEMYSANLEQRKVLEKLLRDGVGAWDLKMLPKSDSLPRVAT